MILVLQYSRRRFGKLTCAQGVTLEDARAYLRANGNPTVIAVIR